MYLFSFTSTGTRSFIGSVTFAYFDHTFPSCRAAIVDPQLEHQCREEGKFRRSKIKIVLFNTPGPGNQLKNLVCVFLAPLPRHVKVYTAQKGI